MQIANMLQVRWLTVGYDHDYISPTWSVSVNVRGLDVPAIVTPYYRNGNALEYLLLHPSTDCLDIIYQAASALAYIHSKGVVHGNVCPVSFVWTIGPYSGMAINLDTIGQYLHHR
jgi:serine/threonine protein kinase